LTTPCTATSSCGHAVRGDYLSRGNAGSTSSAPHAATTSSSSVASHRPFISTSFPN
jgi:hypothetical protein